VCRCRYCIAKKKSLVRNRSHNQSVTLVEKKWTHTFSFKAQFIALTKTHYFRDSECDTMIDSCIFYILLICGTVPSTVAAVM
jgi:hypothetical protein